MRGERSVCGLNVDLKIMKEKCSKNFETIFRQGWKTEFSTLEKLAQEIQQMGQGLRFGKMHKNIIQKPYYIHSLSTSWIKCPTGGFTWPCPPMAVRMCLKIPPILLIIYHHKTTEELQPLLIQKFGQGGYFNHPKDLLDQILPSLRKYNPTAGCFLQLCDRGHRFQRRQSESTRIPLWSTCFGLRVNNWWTLFNHLSLYPCNLGTGIYNFFSLHWHHSVSTCRWQPLTAAGCG